MTTRTTSPATPESGTGALPAGIFSSGKLGTDSRVPFYRNIYVILFVLGALFLTAIRPFMRREPAPPPVQGLIPSFELTSQEGVPFGSKDLQGQVWVGSFLFTSCTTVCPLIARSLVDLQKRYDEAGVPVRIVSFSVDPSTDTPEVLKEYAASVGADTKRWTFLTGEEPALKRVLSSFSMPFEPKRDMGNGMMDIAHSQKLVIVDARGGLRGHYGSDSDGIDEVFHRSQHVLKEKVNAE